MIVEALCQNPRVKKTPIDEDYEGFDFYLDGEPFDLKVTDGIPQAYMGEPTEKDLYLWLLEHQDLDRFHDSNRIIVILEKQKDDFINEDAETIAKEILQAKPAQYFQNLPYILRGRSQDQQNHPLQGEIRTMEKGLLIFQQNNQPTRVITYLHNFLK
jgi:hypothetical protein